jgi:hypothetical protein
MEWFKFTTSLARCPEFIGCEPEGRAAWLCLLAYCVELENGGRIPGALNWKDRQWQQACGVMRSEIEKAKGLIAFDGDDVVVSFYPEKDAKRVRKLRSTSRKAAHARWHQDGMPHGIGDASQVASENDASCNADKRRIDKKKNKSRADESEIVSFCRELGLPDSDGTAMFLKWEENGWMNGKSPIRDWKLTLRRWHSSGWLPSQDPKRQVQSTATAYNGPTLTPEQAKRLREQDEEDQRMFELKLAEGPR